MPARVRCGEGMRPTPNLLFWQPVISGRQSLQQFLRLKVASQLFREPSSDRVGTSQIHEQLVSGSAVEIAGYVLSPGVALGLDSAELTPPTAITRVAWLELAPNVPAELSPAARARVQLWQTAGHRVDARVVTGPAFWQTQEIAECPDLVAEDPGGDCGLECMNFIERALTFDCGGERLVGVVSEPTLAGKLGVVRHSRRTSVPGRQPSPIRAIRAPARNRGCRGSALRLPRHGRRNGKASPVRRDKSGHRRRDRRIPSGLSYGRNHRPLGSVRCGIRCIDVLGRNARRPCRRRRAFEPLGAIRCDDSEDLSEALLWSALAGTGILGKAVAWRRGHRGCIEFRCRQPQVGERQIHSSQGYEAGHLSGPDGCGVEFLHRRSPDILERARSHRERVPGIREFELSLDGPSCSRQRRTSRHTARRSHLFHRQVSGRGRKPYLGLAESKISVGSSMTWAPPGIGSVLSRA